LSGFSLGSFSFCTRFLSGLFSEKATRIIVCKGCARSVCNLCNIPGAEASRAREREISTAFLFPRSRACRRNIGTPWSLPRYAHFHSVAYYYGLYPLFKTGYSNRLDKIAWWRTSAEEIWRWNSA
jgi:hypothetical protein